MSLLEFDKFWQLKYGKENKRKESMKQKKMRKKLTEIYHQLGENEFIKYLKLLGYRVDKI